jgi:hypothetical protein
MTPRTLAQRHHVLFTMTTLGYRYPPGREPMVIVGIRQYLGGWSGIGRVIAGMARQQYDLELTRFGQDGLECDLLPGRDRALADADGGVRLGAGAVDGRAAGGVGGVEEARGGGRQNRELRQQILHYDTRDRAAATPQAKAGHPCRPAIEAPRGGPSATDGRAFDDGLVDALGWIRLTVHERDVFANINPLPIRRDDRARSPHTKSPGAHLPSE